MYVGPGERREVPPGLRADYKVSFLPGECLRISNKAAILSPFATDNEAAPRRWPLLVFCLLTNELVLRYTPSVLLFVFVVLLRAVLSRRLREAQSYFGVRKYTRLACEGCQRAAVAGGTYNIIDKSQRGAKSPGLSVYRFGLFF